jgi:serine/threonine-protein kinase HipA
MITGELSVQVHGRPVARLREHDSGRRGYDLEYLPSAGQEDFIGLTLIDVKTGRYTGFQDVPPVLLQNLPEGALLELVREYFGKTLNLATDFDLLRVIGPHLSGRLTVGEHADEPRHVKLDELIAARGTSDLFQTYVQWLGLRGAGISGMQPKFTSRLDNRATATLGDVIVKFRPFGGGAGGRDYPGLAVNEYFCLRAAAHAGIAVPDFTLSQDGEMLIIYRFDLPSDAPALGFEDACSLAEVAPKYRYHGSYEEMYELLLRWLPVQQRAAAVEDLFRLLLLNVVIGNGDAHRRNHGILYSSLTDIRLAPVYDLVSTLFYLPDDLPALKLIDATAAKAWPDAAQLLRFGHAVLGLTPSRMRDLADTVLEAVGRAAAELEEYAAQGPAAARPLISGGAAGIPLPELWRRRVDLFAERPGPSAG